jgi:hypothetical protein
VTLETLVSIAMLLALAAPVGFVAAWFSGRGAEALSTFFRPDPGLGWPRGVQEEDPPSWNWDARSGDSQDPPTAPSPPAEGTRAAPVAFRIRPGSARR